MASGSISMTAIDEGPDSQIISGVLAEVRESFIESGVDVAVLEKLKELWVSKLEQLKNSESPDDDVIGKKKKSTKKRGKKMTIYDSEDSSSTLQMGQDLLVVTEVDSDESYDVEKDKELESDNSSDAKIAKKKTKRKRILQVDGLNDSSDESGDNADDGLDGDDDDDDEDELSDELDPDGEEYDEGVEQDPLCSEDDISDEEPSELFETDNVVVCQYDKITRARNRWKFHLKDGIMNLNGRDYAFQRANGEAEW